MNNNRQTQSELGLLKSQERFIKTLLINLPGMAYRCENDRPWTMTFVSAGCEALTGHNSEVVNHSRLGWADLIHGDDLDASRLAVNNALKARRQFDIQYRIIDKLGQHKWVREQGCGVYSVDGSVEAIEGYIDDITPLRSAILELAKSKAVRAEKVRREHQKLAHADRLNTLGEMATGIAHEVNQPLTSISLFAETGRRLLELGDYDKLPEVFENLSLHARRAGAIVERMQDMARRKEGVKQTIKPRALLEGVVDLAEIDAGRSNIVIDVKVGKNLSEVEVDVVQIQQVVLNLLRNGMDAMRSLNCSNGNIILLGARQYDDRFLEVSVVDSGCGVSDAAADHLFESFLTTKGTGLGMGLPISKAIVTAHGGQLAFQNNKDCGATFSFTLPFVIPRRL